MRRNDLVEAVRNLNAALTSALEREEAAAMAECCLSRTLLTMDLAYDNPLSALQAKDTERAISIAKLAPAEDACLWGLLMLCWLTRRKNASTEQIQRRLVQDAPMLSGWKAEQAAVCVAWLTRENQLPAWWESVVRTDLGRYRLARTLERQGEWMAALHVAQRLEDGRLRATRLLWIARGLALRGQCDQAEAALALCDDRSERATLLGQLGEALGCAGNLGLARRYFEQALDLARSIADPDVQVATLESLVAVQRSRPVPCQVVLAILRNHENRGPTLRWLADQKASVQDLDQLLVESSSLEQGEERDAIFAKVVERLENAGARNLATEHSWEIRDPVLRATTLLNLAEIRSKATRLEGDMLPLAAKAIEAVTSPPRKIPLLLRLAAGWGRLGMAANAHMVCERAVALSASLREVASRAAAVGEIAIHYLTRGQPTTALQLARDIADPEPRSQMLTRIAEDLVDMEELQDCLTEALNAARLNPNAATRAGTLRNIALGFLKASREEEAFQIVDEINDLGNRVAAMATLAVELARSERHEEAEQRFAEAFQTTESIANVVDRTATLCELVRCVELAKRPDLARLWLAELPAWWETARQANALSIADVPSILQALEQVETLPAGQGERPELKLVQILARNVVRRSALAAYYRGHQPRTVLQGLLVSIKELCWASEQRGAVCVPVVAESGRRVRELCAAALEYFNTGIGEKANACLDHAIPIARAIAVGEARTDALAKVAETLARVKRIAEARLLAQELPEADVREGVFPWIAEALALDGSTTAALQLAENFQPVDSARVWCALGVYRTDQADRDEAEKCFARAVILACSCRSEPDRESIWDMIRQSQTGPSYLAKAWRLARTVSQKITHAYQSRPVESGPGLLLIQRFEAAASVARSIPDARWRGTVLAALVLAELEQGRLLSMSELLRDIQDKSATARICMRRRDRMELTFREKWPLMVVGMIRQQRDEEERDQLYQELPTILKTMELRYVQEHLHSYRSEMDSFQIYLTIAENPALAASSLDTVQVMTEATEDVALRADRLREIAVFHARQEKLETACQTLAQTFRPPPPASVHQTRFQALCTIAEAQVGVDQQQARVTLEHALADVPRMPEERESHLVRVLLLQARAGVDVESQVLALSEDRLRTRVLIGVAESAAAAGQHERARAITAGFADEMSRVRALGSIGRHLLRLGQTQQAGEYFQAASQEIERLNDPWLRQTMQAGLAQEQARQDDPRSDAVEQTNAQLVVQADSVDAAIALCGELARRYPEQATAIRERLLALVPGSCS